MNRLSILTLTVLAGAMAQAEVPKAIFTSVPDPVALGTNVVPGFASDRFSPGTARAFERPIFSPDGSQWVLRGIIAGTAAQDCILRGQGDNATGASIIAREGDVCWFDNSLLQEGLVPNYPGINDAGDVIFSGDVSGSTSADGFLAKYDGNYTLLQRESASAPGSVPSGSLFFGAFNSVNYAQNGVHYFATTGTSSGAGRRTYYIDNTVVYRATQTAINDIDGNPTTFSSLSDGSLRVSASGSQSIFMGTLTAPTGANVVVLNGTVIAQRLKPYPGSGFTSNISNLYTTSPYMSSNGAHYMFYGSNADGVDWAVKDGAIIASKGAPITPTSSFVWDDTDYSQCYFMAASNNLGEYVLGGLTNDATTSNAKIVMNGSRVVLSEGDEVDLDRDGTGDGLYIDAFSDQCNYLADNLNYWFTAWLKDGTGTRVGHGYFVVGLPIPGDVDGDGEVGPNDFSLLSSSFGLVEGDPGYNPDADLDGDGEVGPSDFSILSTNFGRSR